VWLVWFRTAVLPPSVIEVSVGLCLGDVVHLLARYDEDLQLAAFEDMHKHKQMTTYASIPWHKEVV
jgi:hypothetical protein